jgi:TRAP-type C4-dicarboxylate transport system permease small subunit
MRAFRPSLVRALRWLATLAERSCQLSIVAMAGLVLVQVVLRYVFRAPLIWVEEAAIFLMIWMTFVGAGVALRRGAHVAMTVLRDRFAARLSRLILLVSHLAVLAFLLIVLWQAWILAMSVEGQRSPALGVPMVWPYLIIPLGAGFMITQVVAIMLDSRAPRPPAEGRAE